MIYETLVEGLKSVLDDEEVDMFDAISELIGKFDGDLPNEDADDAYDLLVDAVSSEDLSLVQEAVFRMEEALVEEAE